MGSGMKLAVTKESAAMKSGVLGAPKMASELR